MEDRQGQQLGNYKLLHLVGQGGFADVYLGEHIHLRTQAAIKVLPVRLVDSNIQSFLNEARTIAHLIHPYIVRVLDFGVQDNTPFLVMDYAPHGTFRQRFLQGTPLPETPLVPYMKQTAAALQYGHDKKLIHRDVKPENMLLGPNDELLLSDFGLALIAYNSISRSLTETAGTAVYMAPEQLQGKPCPASDQYALGMIAYEWLAGSCPFQGSFFEIASQQVLAQPASLQERAPGTSAEVEKVVMRALEKDPQQRFPNVREFALAFEDACLSNTPYSLDLPSKHTITTNTNAHTSTNSNINTNLPAINHNLISSSQSVFIDEQGARPNEEQEQRSFDNAPFSLLSFPEELASYPISQQGLPSQKNVPIFPTGSVTPSFNPQALSSPLPSSTQSPITEGSTPFLDFPPLSPSLIPNSRETAWTATPAGGRNTFTPSFTPPSNTYLSGSRNFQSTTPGPLKAVAAPIYRDNHYRPANMIVIILIIFIIIASGIGIFALSNSQKAILQQNSVSTSTAAKANTAKAIQANQALQASQTAVASINPYLATNGGMLVLDDPLTSNKNSWQVGPDATGITAGKCAITDQGYQVDAPSVARTPCFQTQQSFTNFTYQVDLTFSAIGQTYSGGGLVFRGSSDLKNYYYFEIYENGNYTLQKCTVLNCTNYIDGFRLGKPLVSSFQTGIDVTNTLAVIANGNTIDLFVNKQKISEVADQISAPYTSGLIGMMATAGNNLGIDTANNTTTTAIFSNAKVWKL
jgi:serine/threonine protein kinase